jgi:MoaA/NifB/PqqE/SkfB family radical SAM enzyme
MNKLNLLKTIAKQSVGVRPPLPVNYTLGLTYRCNARCKTCRIYERDTARDALEELTSQEWRKIFLGLGTAPFWITFTGGEPFLHKDLVEIYGDVIEFCQPAMVNIPTNGLLTDRIIESVLLLLAETPSDVQLTVNLSFDHYKPEINDHIRGVIGYTEKGLKTLHGLMSLSKEHPNLKIGIHTVVSRFNVSDISNIANYWSSYVEPGMYIAEIAENRVELGTVELPIMPSVLQYQRVLGALINTTAGFKGFLRASYYKYVSTFMESSQNTLQCRAGSLSCQIAPNGEVWFCCIKSQSIGSLRDYNYDLYKLWNDRTAVELRSNIKGCTCPMANAFYTNLISSPITLLKEGVRQVISIDTRMRRLRG